MKKTYISPSSLTVTINSRNHLLIDSGTGMTVNASESVSGNFVKEDNPPISDVNVWDNEW